MEINGNLTTSVFLSSLATTSSVNRINNTVYDPSEPVGGRSQEPERRITPLTKISQGLRDVNDGINLLEQASKGYAAINESLTDLQALASAATDEEFTNEERFTLDKRAQQIKDDLVDSVDTTAFKGTSLLEQASNTITLDISFDASGTFEVGAFDIESLFEAVSFDDFDLTSVKGAEASLGILASLTEEVGKANAQISESASRLSTYVGNLDYTDSESIGNYSPIEISIVADDVNSFLQGQLVRDNSTVLQVHTNPDSHQVLGLLKS